MRFALVLFFVALTNPTLFAGEPKNSLKDDAKALAGSWDLVGISPVEYILAVSEENLTLAMGLNRNVSFEPWFYGKYRLVEQDKKRYIEFSDPKLAKASKIPTRIGYQVAGDRLELEFDTGILKGRQTLKRANAKK